jgi:hypothetical protein
VTLYRIADGKEPVAFLRTINQRTFFVVQNVSIDCFCLFTLQGTSTNGVKGFQIRHFGRQWPFTEAKQLDTISASLLNSRDSFVFVTANTIFEWHGKGSDDIEKTYAKRLVQFYLQVLTFSFICFLTLSRATSVLT